MALVKNHLKAPARGIRWLDGMKKHYLDSETEQYFPFKPFSYIRLPSFILEAIPWAPTSIHELFTDQSPPDATALNNCPSQNNQIISDHLRSRKQSNTFQYACANRFPAVESQPQTQDRDHARI